MHHLLRYLLLTLAFALTTYGLIGWHDIDYRLDNVWPFAEPAALHPVHFLALGVAMIAPSLWEIFTIDHRHRHGPHNGSPQPPSP
jgi:hypothetical protein